MLAVSLRFFEASDPIEDLESLVAGVSIQALPEIYDPEGDDVSLDYLWFVDGKVIVSDPPDTLDSAYLKKDDLIYLEVTASDGSLTGSTFVSDSVTVANTIPLVDSAELVPPIIKEESVGTCRGVGWLDKDGDAPAAHFDWEVNGVPLGLDSETIDGASFDKGDVLRCYYEPFDGTDTGVGVWSQNTIVANTAPTLSSSQINPTSLRRPTRLTLTCPLLPTSMGIQFLLRSFGIRMARRPVIRLHWTFPTSILQRGQVIYATVAPYDGEDLGVAVTASSVTIQNAVPEVVSLSITPSPIYTADTASALVSAIDLDGDAVTLMYSWQVDGVEVATTATLDGTAHFEKVTRCRSRSRRWTQPTGTGQYFNACDRFKLSAGGSRYTIDAASPDRGLG